jgi:hypothetical protein
MVFKVAMLGQIHKRLEPTRPLGVISKPKPRLDRKRCQGASTYGTGTAKGGSRPVERGLIDEIEPNYGWIPAKRTAVPLWMPHLADCLPAGIWRTEAEP